MLGILTIAWEEEIEMDKTMEKASYRNALLHRELSMKKENPYFELGTYFYSNSFSFNFQLLVLAKTNCLTGLYNFYLWRNK